jgi:hypothetical protein
MSSVFVLQSVGKKCIYPAKNYAGTERNDGNKIALASSFGLSAGLGLDDDYFECGPK